MQTQNLGNIVLRGYGAVLTDAAERKKGLFEQTLQFESGERIGCYETDDTWILDYQSGMSLLVLYDGTDTQHAQTFYLDRSVALHPGVRFSILPLGETCAVSLYRPCQTPVEPAAFVQAEFLHAYRPQLECEKLYTFFYQESAHDFYFRGERHEPYEMVYVDKGKLHNVVNGQDHLLEQQDLMLIGSNDWHIQYADYPVSFLTLSFSTKNALPPCLINRRLTLPPNLRNTIRLMLQEREQQNLYAYDYLESLLRGLLIELTRMVLDKKPAHETSASLPSTARAENQIVDEAVQIISQRICEKITLEDLADAVHVSVSYLCRIFNSHIGLPPGKYITRIRLEECKTLLREGEYSMGGIARRMGFSSAQHFSKQFRRYFGITPTEYVKSLR